MVKAYFQIKKIPLFLTATPLLFTRQWCSCWLVLSGCREPQVVKDISSMTGSAAGVAVASWCYSLKGQTWCYTSMTWHLHCRFTNRGILLSQADCPTMFDIPSVHAFRAGKVWGAMSALLLVVHYTDHGLSTPDYVRLRNKGQSKLTVKLQRTGGLNKCRKLWTNRV